MNFFGTPSSHQFSKNFGNSVTNDNKRSSSVPYNSPRVTQLPSDSFNFNVIPNVTQDGNASNIPQRIPLKENLPPQINNNTATIKITPKEGNIIINDDNTNKLQSFILKYERQSQDNQTTSDNNNGNSSSNFYAITQYILQAYFKVGVNVLPTLKLVDLIVDQTYTDSLTLRKLNDSSSFQTYEYFNTVPRDVDISRCPIFALSVYFVIRWSHPTQPVTVSNYNEILLLEASLISLDATPEAFAPNAPNVNQRNEKLGRAQNFEPSKKLINIVFPWLSSFKQDVVTVDRTNYKLHSLCELFDFMAKVLIQDLKHLTQNPMLLPNIVSFISKFIPDLFIQEEFQRNEELQQTENGVMPQNSYNNNLINSDLSMMGFSENNPGNTVTKEQVTQMVDSQLTELSKKLTTENVRLSQQISQLKFDVGSLSSMCNQILQIQRQLLSGSVNSNANTPIPHNGNVNSNNNNNNANAIGGTSNGRNGNNTGGIIILDRNSINSNLLNNLVQSFDNNQSNQSPVANVQVDSNTSTLAPIGYSNVPNNGTSFSSNGTPSAHPLPSMTNAQNAVSQPDLMTSTNKRKLPAPLSTLQPSATSPYAMSPGASGRQYIRSDPPYNSSSNNGNLNNLNKRFRADDRPTPSQAALDSLLYKTIPSPKFPDNVYSGHGSRNGSTQINGSNLVNVTDNNNPPQPDNIPPSSNVTGNLLTSKIVVPSERDNITMLSPVNEPMDQIMSNKLDRSYLQNESVETVGQIPNTTAVMRMTTIQAPSPQNPTTGNKVAATESKSTDLPMKLPTITNTLKMSTQGTIGATSNPVISSRPPTSNLNQSKPTGPRNNANNDKKRMENVKIGGPNEGIKYKLSRDNKTIWDLYAEWYIGINGKPSIKKLIEEYGWRRWKVSEDSHFFPTRRIIIDYIEMEVDRGIRLGRFKNPNQPREDIRKILVSDLEKFRINNVLTLNSLSLYFRYMTKRSKEICIFEDFKNWNVRIMSEEEKTKSCRRSHLPAALNNTESSTATIIPINYSEPSKSLPMKEIRKINEGVKPKIQPNKKDQNLLDLTEKKSENTIAKETPNVNKIIEIKNGAEYNDDKKVADSKIQDVTPIVDKTNNTDKVDNGTNKGGEAAEKNDDPSTRAEAEVVEKEGKD
ncbi:hypothetical protein C6P45_000456 [Maudiozyma exigua]|uniref:Transcription activator GCR1-like domain-containing protein n=1 Tax=Maudiozyma exigua TaxID=34358 RepID=A0A9P6W832_MAUEX|nr:hypothetical protein C6P45_000456 [Kazachstania exigua]